MPNVIEVGGVTAGRGELKKGVIKGVELVNNVSIDIPVLVMNGVEEGPTLLLMSTQHGTEIQGIEVIRRVMRERLDPKALRGAVISVPVANPLAFMHHQYLSWIDNLDVGGGGSGFPASSARHWSKIHGFPMQPRAMVTPSTPVCSNMRITSRAVNRSPLPNTVRSPTCFLTRARNSHLLGPT